MAKMIRLDKYLVEMEKGSRSQIKEAAKKGRIQVNGQVEKKTERKIDADADQVLFDGVLVSYQALEYYMLNKPQGVVSATEDNLHRTVIDLIDGEKRRDLFPVGRLDIDTEGLLILTNDGDLAHRLLAPKKHVDKQYYALVSGDLPADSVQRMADGMTLSDGTAVKPAVLEIGGRCVYQSVEAEVPCTETRLTIREGKFHQVKRMFEALGCHVEYLKRLSMGGLMLDESLQPGEYRRLTGDELSLLQETGNVAAVCGDPCESTAREQIISRDRQVNRTQPASENIQIGTDSRSTQLTRLRAILDDTDAVLFDLDGTLVDSMWMWKEIDIEYLGRFGHTCPPLLQKEIEGMSFSETAVYFKETFGIPDSLDEIKQAWIDMSIEKYRSEVPLKPGAGRFLDYLKGHGIKAGIATSNGRDMVDAVLNSLKIAEYFEVITTACEVAAGKPAPDIYLKVAEHLNAVPDRCLVFEDVPAGIQAGKAAGMTVCAVEDAFSSEMRAEKETLADFFINDYNELLDIRG